MSCASPDDNDVKRKSSKSTYEVGAVPLHVVSRIKGERGTHNQIHIHLPWKVIGSVPSLPPMCCCGTRFTSASLCRGAVPYSRSVARTCADCTS